MVFKNKIIIFVSIFVIHVYLLHGMQKDSSGALGPFFRATTPDEMLVHAIWDGNLKAAEDAIKKGATLNKKIKGKGPGAKYAQIRDNALNTALGMIELKNFDAVFPIVDLLLVSGADVNAEGENGTPLVVAISEKYWAGKCSPALINFLINHNANYNDEVFCNLLSKMVESDTSQIYYQIQKMINSYKKILEESKTKPSDELLDMAIRENFVPHVRKFLEKGCLPQLETIRSVQRNMINKELRILLLSYLRLVGPLGIYHKKPIISWLTWLFGERWQADEKWGPISKTGILTMNAQSDNEIIVLPAEVVLNVIKFVVE